MARIDDLYWTIMFARIPRDIFSSLSGDTKEQQIKSLEGIYQEMAKEVNPRKFVNNLDEQTRAEELSKELGSAFEKAKAKIKAGIYGQLEDTTRKHSDHIIRGSVKIYRVFDHWAEGDIADVYRAECDESDGSVVRICLKIVRDPADNDLMRNEIKVMNLLKHKSLPVIIEDFELDGRVVNAMHYITRYDLVTLREKFYPKGVDQFHACWIFERLLSVLGFMHTNMILHGNIEPNNVIVRPPDHNAFLIDFIYAITAPTQHDNFTGYNKDFSAPEVAKKMPPIPSSDMYSLGKTMVYLFGGDVCTNELPDTVDKLIQNFILRFLDPDPMKRKRDAWGAWHEINEIRRQIFGPKEFVEFIVNPNKAKKGGK